MSDENGYNSEQSIETRAREQRHEDFTDLQNELAGRETGKMARFLTPEERERRSKNPASRKRSNTALDILLMNADYRAQYDATMATLTNTEDLVLQALIAAADRVRETRIAMEDTEARAATLPDGTKVFRARDGKVYSKDGKEIDATDIALITWPDDAPSWEDYRDTKNAHDDARANHTKFSNYQTRLDDIRTRMEDTDNPPSADDMKRFNDEMETMRKDAAGPHLQSDAVATQKPDETTVPDLNLPSL